MGRAGRAVERAYGILLSGREDDAIAEYFMSTAFPPAARMKDILAALEKVESATIRGLQAQVNLPYGQIEKALKLLEVDGAVARERGRFVRTAMPWEQDEAWVAAVLEARRRELASMQAYVDTTGCRMEFLGRLLNDPAAGACGHCANDGGIRWPRAVDAGLVQEAVTFLRRDVRGIEPRRQWPDATRIPKPNEMGRALCMLGDPGWGRDVARGRSAEGAVGPGGRGAGRFEDHLVGAATEVIRGRWRPNPEPEWVTCVPSASRPGLVEAFAERLASALALPFVPCVTVAAGGPPQAPWRTAPSRPRTRAVGWGSWGPACGPGRPPGGRHRGLALDATVAGSLLREHGSGPVLPFALAVAVPRGE